MNAKKLYDTLTEDKRQELAQALIEKNVYACQTSLVYDLLNKNDFSYDDITNLYYLDRENAAYFIFKNEGESVFHYINEKHNRRITEREFTEVSLLHFFTICDEDELRDVCDNFCYYDLEKVNEIFEWHLISDYLAEKLIEYKEPVLKNEFGTWFGRTTTGQAMFLDYTMQMIACAIESDLQNSISKYRKVGL